MPIMLAVDIGGTKTLFQLFNEQGDTLLQLRLDSQRFDSFDDCLKQFLHETAAHHHAISSACIAVAGPVNGDTGRVTKLPWRLDASELQEKFQIANVRLCNDFEAVGYGISCLSDNDLITLQTGNNRADAPRAVIGSGTGLGQAILVPIADEWRVLPTEGGHVDFAPLDRKQQLLLEHMKQRHQHVSYDRLVCGSGLVNIYNFLRDYQQLPENADLRVAMVQGDAAAAISEYAASHHDPLANKALDMFVRIYGAQAGNLALACLPYAGIYLAGGIVTKNLAKFGDGKFLKTFKDKGRMQDLMANIPVYIILDEQVGLKGARLLATKAMYN
ncbi:glucokinase [Methylophaga sp.]|uniref:glucokinase n=1 Tax=Methylophaga sp. TaxID=2024840 RepID=UPI003F69D10C